jgi:hypothetical protein
MDKLTTTLLAGAAIAALSAAPVLAKPALLIHNGIKVVTATIHYKTDVQNPARTVITETLPSEVFTGNRSTLYKKTKNLTPGETWLSVTAQGKHCFDFTGTSGQKETFSKDSNAKVKAYTYKSVGTHTFFTTKGATGHCTGTLTMYAPAYELRSKIAATDSFDGFDAVKFTTTTTTTGTKHRQKKHRFELRAKEPWTININ